MGRGGISPLFALPWRLCKAGPPYQLRDATTACVPPPPYLWVHRDPDRGRPHSAACGRGNELVAPLSGRADSWEVLGPLRAIPPREPGPEVTGREHPQGARVGGTGAWKERPVFLLLPRPSPGRFASELAWRWKHLSRPLSPCQSRARPSVWGGRCGVWPRSGQTGLGRGAPSSQSGGSRSGLRREGPVLVTREA